MKKKKLLALLLVVTMIVTLFSACGKKEEPTNNTQPTETVTTPAEATEAAEEATPTEAEAAPAETSGIEQVLAQFPNGVTNDAASINGGVLKVAITTESAFAGVLNPCFYEDNYDYQVMRWFTETILSSDENFVFDQDGAATYEYDTTAKTMTLKMKEGVKWHDGQPVTLDDLVYAYEVICHKDYVGMRYDTQFTNIVGAEEFHAGKADSISGLTLSDDKMTLTIQFKEFYPSILVGGIWISPIPRHYYGDIAVKEMSAHEKTRKTPIGFGPFKVKNIVPGESVEYERFDDYYLGAPKLDGVIVSVISQELVPAAMEEGKFDIALFTAQQYPDYKTPTNYSYIGEIQTVFSYTGFKLGKWDQATNANIYDPNAKMANVNLRQAIGYAVDNATIADQLYNGLRFLATTVITPRHSSYQNTEITGYTYDPEKAKQLLDEAGYIDVNGDGFREDPKGQPFVITWATMDGENADTLAQFKIQNWTDVGLKVELYNGRLTEFNAFYEAVEADDPAIDMYDGAWQTGFDPNPSGLWGPDSAANYTRYTSDRFNSLIKDISSDKGWDNAFLSSKYQEWQQAFFEEAPAIPTLWRLGIESVNNRVKNYELTSFDIKVFAHLIELTADESVKK